MYILSVVAWWGSGQTVDIGTPYIYGRDTSLITIGNYFSNYSMKINLQKSAGYSINFNAKLEILYDSDGLANLAYTSH